MKRFSKGGGIMEYLYTGMLLKEIGKEISVANIQKIYTALDLEADDAKIQFFTSALSILATGKEEKVNNETEEIPNQQLKVLLKRMDSLENSISKVCEIIATPKRESEAGCKACHVTEAVEEKVQTEKIQTEKIVESEYVQTATANVTQKPSEMEEQDKSTHQQPGRYVYGIASGGVSEYLGAIGLDGAEVYTIPYKEACIIVHDCPAQPYESEDENAVKEWLFTQQEVLDIAAEKFGGVLPMSFDMIIEGKNESDPEQAAIMWLEKNYDNFMETIAKIKNKQEFGIQVILDTGNISEKLFDTDEKLRKKKEEIDAKPEGIAYMEREILKDLIKEKIEEKADNYFKEFYAMIKKHTDDIVVGKVKKVGGSQQMLMNLSCLVRKDMVVPLGEELEKIENHDGISVRFSGPWAPYSFVTPEKGVSSSGVTVHE